MSDALSRYGHPDVPQDRPIPGREADMVQNDAGGYVFAKGVWTRLADFLVLGTEGGTYYADERTHTYRNVQAVQSALRADGGRVVQMAVEYSNARPPRAPKNYPALYVIAAALADPDVSTRRAAADAVPRVARTVDHLSHLFGYYKSMDGSGSGHVSSPTVVQRAWLNWFRHGEPNDVAFKILKAGQRKTGDGEPFRPGDLLRLCHPNPRNPNEDALFGLATGKYEPIGVTGNFASAKAYYEASRADTPAKAIKVIRAYHVPWEFLPDEVLKYPEVWRALIPHMGLTALIRNLARMTDLCVFKPLDDSIRDVEHRLTDQAELHRARIHPFDLMLASLTYGAGYSQPNPKAPLRRWEPNRHIQTALDQALNLSYATTERREGKLIIAVDRSGSMGQGVLHGGALLGGAYHVASASALALLRTWGADSHVIEFDTEVRDSKLRADMTLGEVVRLSHRGGGTDLASPIQWALRNRIHCDAFVVLTDNESWAGRRHPTSVLADYRYRINPHARLIVVSTTASGYMVGDPGDPGVLNIAGFDSALPTLVAGYLAAGGAG